MMTPDPTDSTAEPAPPTHYAEAALAQARALGAQPRIITALIDLGLARVQLGDGPGAVASLGEALTEARRLGDPGREADAAQGLAAAALLRGWPDRAREAADVALAHALRTENPLAEKLARDALGQALAGLRLHAEALKHFQRAGELARVAGDAPHEATLSWQTAIQHAELGEISEALAAGGASVALLERLGQPQADWFARHLDEFRAGERLGKLPQPAAFGGVIAAGIATPIATGPGVLRLAVNASHALARFVGSGFTLAPTAHRDARLAVCNSCDQHTGVRCRVCGCITAVKARLASEVCPLGRWPS